MPGVKVITSDNNFAPEVLAAGDKLVVIDFHATWCGPCKNIAPIYEQMSTKFANVVFLKVDVDVCKATAEKFNIEAMPTFCFVKNQELVGQVRGADPQKLLAKITELAGGGVGGAAGPSEEEEVPGYIDMQQFIMEAGCNCLNESDDNTHKNIFKDDPKFLESDCDEQLMLTITFNQAVKVHSLKIRGPTDGTAPKTIKIFANQPNEVDFDSGERMEAVQKLELEADDVTGEKVIPLRFVKFQNISNLVIFVVDNQGGDEITKLEYLKIFGQPCNATNMGDFKRVSGKAGESHMG